MNLTETVTAAYEHRRQSLLGAPSPAEGAANALLDAAWQVGPRSARRALHVAVYAQRIGDMLRPSQDGRRLWMLGLLSVLAPGGAQDYPVFAAYRADERSARILAVAHAFEDAVEAFGADESLSPAHAVRYMMRCDRYDPDVVLALRRAIAGSQAAPAVKARSRIAANQSGP